MRIVLASTSRHRRMLLDRAGIVYEAMAPECDERLEKDLPPPEATLELAVRKARSVAACVGGGLVVGSDQMAVLRGRILHKPGTERRAVEQLMQLAGRTHELWTAVALLDTRENGGLQTHAQVHRLTMRAMDEGQARAYVRADDPLDCAGSYRFESRGVRLFEKVVGEDPTAITGLPMMALVGMLMKCGVSFVHGMEETGD